MAIDRERIYSTLFTLVSGATQFATVNRRLRHWSDVSPAEQPALFMSEKGGVATSKAYATPQTYILRADFFIYAHSADPYLSPSQVLNPLIDAVELALAASQATGLQQLGLPEMVQHVRVEGHIETDEGVLGDQAIAIIPVEIFAV